MFAQLAHYFAHCSAADKEEFRRALMQSKNTLHYQFPACPSANTRWGHRNRNLHLDFYATATRCHRHPYQICDFVCAYNRYVPDDVDCVPSKIPETIV